MFLIALPILNISSLNAQSLDEIIVTAQKEESIQDTQFQQLLDQRIWNKWELLKLVMCLIIL